MSDSANVRSFQMHENLLKTVIERQTGTLDRAVMEAVQNSIDAGCTRVEITLTNDRLIIKDDGRGFADMTDVVKYFESFGRPHEAAEDKQFGEFRMGRGQLFAHGLNVWRTNNLRLTVDISQGLGYRHETAEDHVPGCEIDITLRHPVSVSMVGNTLKKSLKWVSTPITLNGELVSRDPETVKWSYSCPEGHIRFNGSATVDVYSCGFFVQTRWTTQGHGCTIVSRKPLRLNFARSEVMFDCPVSNVLLNHASDLARTVRNELAAIRPNAARLRRLMSGLDVKELDLASNLPICRDALGRVWSLCMLRVLLNRFRHYVAVVTSAELAESKSAARLLTATHTGLVLVSDDGAARVGLAKLGLHSRDQGRPLSELLELKPNLTLLSKQVLTKQERRSLDAITTGVTVHTPQEMLCRFLNTRAVAPMTVTPYESGANAHPWCDGFRGLYVPRAWLENLTEDRLVRLGLAWVNGMSIPWSTFRYRVEDLSLDYDLEAAEHKNIVTTAQLIPRFVTTVRDALNQTV